MFFFEAKKQRHLSLLLIAGFISVSFLGYYIFYPTSRVELFLLNQQDLVPMNTLLNGLDHFSAIYAFGRPSLDSDWKSTEIFENQNFAIVGAVFQKNGGALSFVEHALTQTNCSSVTVCIRLAKKGLSSESCSRIFCTEKPSIDIQTLNNSEITHVFIQNMVNIANFSLSTLVSQIFPISPSHNYFFCYGLPENVINASYSLITNCPPCLCSSVFSRQILFSNLIVINDQSQGGVNYDDNVNVLANKLLKYSRFTPCLQMKNKSENHHEPSDVFLVGDSPILTASSAWAVHKLYESSNMPLMLEGGTMLGWYRNCSVVWDDVDIDFSLPNKNLNNSFYKKVVQLAYSEKKPITANFLHPSTNISVDLKSTRIFGDLDYGVEVRFDVRRPGDPVVGVDVFVLYIDEPASKYNYVQGFVTWERSILHYGLPQNLTLCSTIFLGDLYLVPCEPEFYLVSHYGSGWNAPQPRKDGYWYHQPNIVEKVQLTAADWASRKMYQGFE